MKKLFIIKAFFLTFFVSNAQGMLNFNQKTIEKRSKFISDQVINTLEFTSESRVDQKDDVYFKYYSISSEGYTELEYKDTPYYNQPIGRKYIVVKYRHPNYKKDVYDTKGNIIDIYSNKVYIWLDTSIPFLMFRNDNMGINLKYNKDIQPYYRVGYSLSQFEYPAIVKPNEVLTFEYYESKGLPDNSGWMTDIYYTYDAEKSKGVELLEDSSTPFKSGEKRIIKVKVISDEAYIHVDIFEEGHEVPY